MKAISEIVAEATDGGECVDMDYLIAKYSSGKSTLMLDLIKEYVLKNKLKIKMTVLGECEWMPNLKPNQPQEKRNSHVHPVLQDTINSFSTIFGRDGEDFMNDIKSITDDYEKNHPDKINKP